jgi:hypothetical protein
MLLAACADSSSWCDRAEGFFSQRRRVRREEAKVLQLSESPLLALPERMLFGTSEIDGVASSADEEAIEPRRHDSNQTGVPFAQVDATSCMGPSTFA